MHFIHSPTREIQITFAVVWLIPNLKLLYAKLSSSLKYIKALRLFNSVFWFYFILLETAPNGLVYCNFLMKMRIRRLARSAHLPYKTL